MDRYWLLTWHTYGTWLPGDPRGFVSDFRAEDGTKRLENVPHTPCTPAIPALHRHATEIRKEDPVLLNHDQAVVVAEEFRETAAIRGWQLLALAILPNHVHIVVGVPGDPDPEKLLGDFKAYATRRLNSRWVRRTKWWTESGSRRKKSTAAAIRQAVFYVRNQAGALVVWLGPGVAEALARTEASGAASARRSKDQASDQASETTPAD